MDGAVCEISHQQKLTYLQRVKEAGISNMEMECTAIASLCRMTGVRCAVVCVALTDRLKGDQVLARWLGLGIGLVLDRAIVQWCVTCLLDRLN